MLFTSSWRVVQVGMSTQDVLAELGPADAQYFTRRIVLAESGRSELDYFLNYFALGLDVLVDGASLTVKEFVLHTNPLLHASFGRYRKCNFEILAGMDAQAELDALAAQFRSLQARQPVRAGALATLLHVPLPAPPEAKQPTPEAPTSSSPSKSLLDQGASIGPDATWTRIREVLGDPLGGPVGGRFYGYDGLVFEIIEGGQLASASVSGTWTRP